MSSATLPAFFLSLFFSFYSAGPCIASKFSEVSADAKVVLLIVAIRTVELETVTHVGL